MEFENTSLQTIEKKGEAVQALVGRESQQIQGMVYMAKQYPRDEQDAYNRIMKSCSRITLAEDSMYEYPRGGQKVTGPSIRLAEALAQSWGNVDFGVVELEQKNGESTVMAYAWDLETNTRQTKIFAVKHERGTKQGNKSLVDPRDIYEMVANQGARRVRACILGIIPGDIVDAAVDKCKDTIKSGNKKPISDRIRDMIAAFESEYQVKKTMLEKYIGCVSDSFSENDFIRLRNVFKSLKDGMTKREDYFEIEKPKVEHNPSEDESLKKEIEEFKAKKGVDIDKQPDIFDQVKEVSK
jgi:hypothetical protein